MRYTFDPQAADYVVQPPQANTNLLLMAAPNVTGTAWSAREGGERYTDLLVDGNPADSLQTDGTGLRSAALQGPDGVKVMYLDFNAGNGPRFVVYGTEAFVSASSVIGDNDPRLSDARTPLPHAQSHGAGGTDEITVDASQVASGVLAPARLGGGVSDGTKVLFGDGQWKDAAATGGAVSSVNGQTGDVVLNAAAVDAMPSSYTPSWAAIDNKPSTFPPSAHTHDGAEIASGTVPPARLGTGTANSGTVLYGDGQWRVAPDGGSAADLQALTDPKFGGYYLDSPRYTGTDDQRLTAAIADQKASAGVTNYAPIILPSRPLSFNQSRQLYTGCRIIGVHRYGQKNPDIASGNYSGPEITLGSTLGSGASSWWTDPGGNCYDVYMADFSVQGSQGSAKHQFIDNPSNTLYACEFHSLAFNFMYGVFGNDTRKSLMTQVNLSGMWTMNNAWNCQINAGGSDNTFWMDAISNIGIASSAAQTGNLDRYFIKLDSMELNMGKAYCSSMNGWRGMLISGGGSVINLYDGVFEGYKPTRINGLIEGPAPGSVIKITGGTVSMYGTKCGQGMDNPDASENGLVQITGGEVNMFGVNFYGRNMGTVNAVDHRGGRLMMLGITKRLNEGAYWSGRPRVATTATAGSGTTSFYCPDQSVTVV